MKKHKDKKKETKKEKKDSKEKGKEKTEKKETTQAIWTRKTNVGTDKPIEVLVIDSDDKDWTSLFKDHTFSGQPFKVTKCRWENMVVHSELSGKVYVNCKPNESPLPGTDEGQFRTCSPDFVVVRKLVRGLSDREDYTNALYGLLFAGIPAVNSLEAVHACLERPVVTAALNGIKRRLGPDAFPLIHMHYYSHHTAMMFTPEPPMVVKVGYAEAGYGKMMFKDSSNFTDFKSVVALHHDYVTIEDFVEDREYDLRIQKVGNHYRAYKRVNSNWKGNVGSSIIEEIPMTDKFQLWAEEAGKLFGGLDILTVDAIHTTSGKDYIIEINDSPSGFLGKNELEDMGHVRDLVLEKLASEYPQYAK